MIGYGGKSVFGNSDGASVGSVRDIGAISPEQAAYQRQEQLRGAANAYQRAPDPTPPGVATWLQLLANAQGETDKLLDELRSRLSSVLRESAAVAEQCATPPSAGTELAVYIADRCATQRCFNESLSDLLARIDL